MRTFYYLISERQVRQRKFPSRLVFLKGNPTLTARLSPLGSRSRSSRPIALKIRVQRVKWPKDCFDIKYLTFDGDECVRLYYSSFSIYYLFVWRLYNVDQFTFYLWSIYLFIYFLIFIVRSVFNCIIMLQILFGWSIK